MASQLPSKRWRGRVRNPRTGKQVSPHTVIGGHLTFATRREAERAEDAAREMLHEAAMRGVTVREWWETWTTDPLWARPESTNAHNRERTKAFADAYGDRPLRSIGADEITEWLKGERNVGTVPSLRAMFADAGRMQAGRLIDFNPFAGLGLRQSRGRKDAQPPSQAQIADMLVAADTLTPPSFAAYLFAACYSAARPGELDALKWTDLSFAPGDEAITIERQWNVKVHKFTTPKHGSRRTIAMVQPLRERLLTLPRESEWAFTTIRGSHYTPSSRSHHWNRVRSAVGLGDVSLYLATRHYFGWYALNVLALPPHVIALQLGHTDGGRLVRELYGHPDAAIARQLTREAFRQIAPVTPLHARDMV